MLVQQMTLRADNRVPGKPRAQFCDKLSGHSGLALASGTDVEQTHATPEGQGPVHMAARIAILACK